MSLPVDEHETLIRAIDVLSMEVLRLKSENEILKKKVNERKSEAVVKPGKPKNIWTRAINYYHREGFSNTVKKVFSKLSKR